MATLRTKLLTILSGSGVLLLILVVLTCLKGCSGSPSLQDWHTEKLNEEFTADRTEKDVHDFEDYLLLEDSLFSELERKKSDTVVRYNIW